MAQRAGGALAIVSLALLGAAAPDAGRSPWTPYDFLSDLDRGCAVRAALPGPGGTWLIGSDCNRLDGHEIGSLVVLDADGGLDARPESLTLDAEAERDRFLELSELHELPSASWGGGWLAGYGVLNQRALRHGGARYPGTDRFQRYLRTGHRDRAWEARFEKALQAALGERPALIDTALDAHGDLLVLANATGAPRGQETYLQTDPLWLLRVAPDGHVDRATALSPLLASLDLGYYEALQVVPRPSGGAWITGRFPSRSDPHHRPQIYAISLTSAGALDRAFVEPLLAAAKAGGETIEIRLAAAGPGDTLVCVGGWAHPPRNPNVFRLTRAGAIDPTFRPFALPGTYPQGRFLFAGELARDGAGNWLVSFVVLPGAVPPQAGPGLVRLEPDGVLDRGLLERLGLGLRDSTSATRTSGGGQLTLVVPAPQQRILLAGNFDRLGSQLVTSPLILRDDGSADPLFHPHFSTELPPPTPPSSAQTSDYVPADGQVHYLACRKAGASRATTYLYETGSDAWGHQPSCMIHYGGDILSPGGGWQDCDLRVAQEKEEGATCSEVAQNPSVVR